MPVEMQKKISSTWTKIHEMLGTEFNFDFWQHCEPRRSTYPACRAVLAADKQEKYNEMTDAIQRAYYLRAKNPSDIRVLELLAEEINLNMKDFCNDMSSSQIQMRLLSEKDFSSQSPIDGFPSLVLSREGEMTTINRDYRDFRPSLEHIYTLIS